MLEKLKIATIGVVLTATIALIGCNSQPAATADKAEAPAEQIADKQLATAAYRCPMGCKGSASDKPGKCPVCLMELERNPAYQAAPATAATDSL
ncbi:MAG TPA: heavy metal-binding domain-containing protein [Hymenobacter sp.]